MPAPSDPMEMVLPLMTQPTEPVSLTITPTMTFTCGTTAAAPGSNALTPTAAHQELVLLPAKKEITMVVLPIPAQTPATLTVTGTQALSAPMEMALPLTITLTERASPMTPPTPMCTCGTTLQALGINALTLTAAHQELKLLPTRAQETLQEITPATLKATGTQALSALMEMAKAPLTIALTEPVSHTIAPTVTFICGTTAAAPGSNALTPTVVNLQPKLLLPNQLQLLITATGTPAPLDPMEVAQAPLTTQLTELATHTMESTLMCTSGTTEPLPGRSASTPTVERPPSSPRLPMSSTSRRRLLLKRLSSNTRCHHLHLANPLWLPALCSHPSRSFPLSPIRSRTARRTPN